MSEFKKIIGIIFVCLFLQTSIFIINSYCADEDLFTGVDISKNNDGSIIAKLSEDEETLNITGSGEMKLIGNTFNKYKSKIKTINISEDVTSIGNNAFNSFVAITTVELPQKLEKIGNNAFSYCRNLNNINLPQNLISIEQGAFSNCSSLNSITIPSNVTNIGIYVFDNCKNLMSINVDNNNLKYKSENGILINKENAELVRYPGGKEESSFSISNKLTRIGNSAFDNCSNLKNIEIPSSVTFIDDYAFYKCNNLSNITIPSSVTSIGDSAFNGCSSLSNISIPNGVTSIGDSAFNGCSSLSNISIPNGVTSIGDSAFNGCISLSNINIPNSVTYIGESVFNNCSSLININVDDNNLEYKSEDGVLFNKDKTEIIRYPENKNESSYSILNGVKTIGISAFKNCKNLKSIENLNGVTIIKEYAFSNCSNLINIEIPSSVETIEAYAFSNCNNLINIEIPSSVTKIKNSVFYNCKKVVAITTEEEEQEIMPELLLRALDENDILHTTKEFILTNCEMNEAGDKIKINSSIVKSKEVSIRVNDGALNNLKIIIVPSGTITYNEIEPTKEVISTLHLVEGETITNNNGSMQHTFIRNGSFDYSYTTKEGEEKTSTATVNSILDLESNIYNINDNNRTIINIQPKTTVEMLKTGLITNATEIEILDRDNTILSQDNIIATGMKIKLNEKTTFTLVIKGDTNGDGESNIYDILDINKHRLNKVQLTDEYMDAGDVTQDGKVDINDILLINKYRLRKISDL